MLKSGLTAALLATTALAATALAAQPSAPAAPPQTPVPAPPAPPATPAPPPEFFAAVQGFGQCVETGARGVAATVTPEAGATAVLAGCATQRQELERQVYALIDSPVVPADRKEAARAQARAQLAEIPARIAGQIRQSRAPQPPAPPAPPSPRPNAPPAPPAPPPSQPPGR